MDNPDSITICGGIRTSDKPQAVHEALAKAQAAMEPATHDRQGEVRGNREYRYTSLARIMATLKGPFAANNLVVLHGYQLAGNKATITTRIVCGESWVETDVTMGAGDASAHAVGSACTYGRKYGIGLLAGIVTEDDDDGAAITETEPARKPAPPPPPPKDDRPFDENPAFEEATQKSRDELWDACLVESDGDEGKAQQLLIELTRGIVCGQDGTSDVATIATMGQVAKIRMRWAARQRGA